MFITGAQWAALQAVAWTTMLAGNLRTQSFSQAVSETFDGRHPCPLCKAIAAGKKSEKKADAVSPLNKSEFPPANANIALLPPDRFEWMPVTHAFADCFTLQPPVPPPRSLPA